MKDSPQNWATAQTSLGGVLDLQARDTEGPDGAKLFADAVTAYRNKTGATWTSVASI